MDLKFRVSSFEFRVGVTAVLLLVSLCFWSTPGQAQAPFNSKPETRNSQPLFWADGITQPDQLDNYARAGFNTVVIRLFWQPTPDGSIVASDLEPQRAFAEMAETQNLKVIYALPPAPYSQENNFSYSGEAGPYRVMWANWTQRAISQLRATPNCIGWMLPDDPRALPFTNESGFARWLGGNYGSIATLNKQWNANFPAFENVTLGSTRQLVQAWRGTDMPQGDMSKRQMEDYIRRAQNRRPNENFAFHPAALALARYQWDAYRGLLDFWAQTIRSSDPNRKIFSGKLPDYAQLLSLPASVDVSVAAASPAVMEPDAATHNPHSVDIARRGGRFQAVALLSTSLPQVSVEAIARLAPSWMDAALAHGATGIAFDSWPEISKNRVLRRAISASFQRLQGVEYSGLWGRNPVATSAVVLTPLADGVTLHFNTPNAPNPNDANAPTGSTPGARGVYGFGEDMIEGEPSALAFALRWGSAFGSVDYLSPDELGGGYSLQKNGLLKRYGVVLLPQALSIDGGMAQELSSYVAGGGTIVTDLGVGAWQNESQVMGLPPEMTMMLGVIPTSLQTIAFNLKPGMGHPLLPTWAGQAAMRTKILTAGDGPDGAAFAGPIVFGELQAGTIPLALAFDMTMELPGKKKNDSSDNFLRVQRSWLSLRPYGNGSAIFAPFRLWSLWRPGHPGFDGFHGDLFARGHAMTQVGIETLTSTPAGTPEGAALFVEAVNFPNAIALINHNAAPNAPYGGFVEAASTPAPAAPEIALPAPTIEAPAAITPQVAAPDASAPNANYPPAITPDTNTAPEISTPAITPASSKRNVPIVRASAAMAANAGPTSGTTTIEPPVTLTPEEFEALFGKPAPAPPKTPKTPTGSTPGAPNIPAAPTVPILPNPSQPTVVQTSGSEYFLWKNALCIFPVGAAPTPTPGRSTPLPADSQEFTVGSIVRPPFFHPVVLYAHVPAMEMKVLRMIPIRVQSSQGRPLGANVAEYTTNKIQLRVWPNAEEAFLRRDEWRLKPGREGTVRIAVFDGGEENSYRVAPNSRHRISKTERSTDDGSVVLSTTNYQLTADNSGRISFEISGTSIGIEISPLP